MLVLVCFWVRLAMPTVRATAALQESCDRHLRGGRATICTSFRRHPSTQKQFEVCYISSAFGESLRPRQLIGVNFGNTVDLNRSRSNLLLIYQDCGLVSIVGMLTRCLIRRRHRPGHLNYHQPTRCSRVELAGPRIRRFPRPYPRPRPRLHRAT